MATLSNPTFFKGGVEGGPQLVGYTKASSDGSYSNYVVRYTLTLDPNESGDHIYVYMATKGYLEWYNIETKNKVNKDASLYFKIGTDPVEFANAGYAQRLEATGKVNMVSTSSSNANYDVEFEADAMLLPGYTYYVWIFPGFALGAEPTGNYTMGQFEWYGLSYHVHTINLSGAAGLVTIDIGSALVKAIPLIDLGDRLAQAIPYMDSGSDLNICG